jgi:hypothetical protein
MTFCCTIALWVTPRVRHFMEVTFQVYNIHGHNRPLVTLLLTYYSIHLLPRTFKSQVPCWLMINNSLLLTFIDITVVILFVINYSYWDVFLFQRISIFNTSSTVYSRHITFCHPIRKMKENMKPREYTLTALINELLSTYWSPWPRVPERRAVLLFLKTTFSKIVYRPIRSIYIFNFTANWEMYVYGSNLWQCEKNGIWQESI